MGELLNRLSLYAAVDLAFQDAARRGDREFIERIAAVIPAYRFDLRPPDDPGGRDTASAADGQHTTARTRAVIETDPGRNIAANGWAADALELIGRDWVDATEACDQMADTPPPTAVDAGRRIKAIWMLIHAGIVAGDAPRAALEAAVREYQPDRSTVAHAAMAADDDNVPVDLYDHLTRLGSAVEYRQRLAEQAPRFVSSAVVAAAATTCDDSTEYVTPGPGSDVDVAAVMTTRTTRPVGPDLTVDALRDLLHPDRWPVLLSSFWCAMVPSGPDGGTHAPGVATTGFTRQEVVGDFGNPPRSPTWDPPTDAAGADALCPGTDVWFQPILRFRHRVVPDGFELQFRLAEPGELGPHPQDERFLIDAGAMSTRLRGGVVEVATSKVLLMKAPISCAGLGIFACAMGYGDMGTAMLEGALAN